ncbi:hypothetical protein N825_13880 [Skermanella stibiiresistens SB22]|uniref:Uncharacterized protein n=1 Tax=Skermanella stibiiresistens SB22 TaxID=1385369 RepID=W9H3F0_9PROT|nr:hypothetical protein [Skermanella stibiiresistens]EWY38293.1 hypothetical protein N825_13880 [Skermanella stibiiresistens SB22]
MTFHPRSGAIIAMIAGLSLASIVLVSLVGVRGWATAQRLPNLFLASASVAGSDRGGEILSQD